MSDLMRMMQDAAAESTERPNVNQAWRRARLHRAGFVALSLIAVIAVTGGVVIAASSFGESDTRPALPDDIEPDGGGAIAFSRSGPLGGIYVIESVDGDPVRVTSTKGDDHPAWSPDGSRIAFVRYEESNQNIYVMKADGTTTVKLTDDGASGNPTWSPDGTRIAFQRQMDGDTDIYVMNADGTDVTQLTDDWPGGKNPLIEYTPAWSPDGTSIAFVAYSYVPSGPTPTRLYVVNADGGGRRQLPAEDVAQPGWSPDGTKIAFVDSQRGSLYVINADGTGLRQVVDLAGVTEGRGNLTMSPSWSPDGTRIAFATGSTATSTHIYLVNEDGSGLLQLTDDPVSDAEPDWAPASPQESSTIHTNDETGLAITTPADWTIRWSQPPESTALYGATYDFDRSTSFCSSTGPLTTLPPDGAFFWMYEFDLPDAPARPENFSFDEESFASYEGSGCVPTYRMDFADGGRTFSVHVAFGSEAGAALRDELITALDSLEVRSGASEDPPPEITAEAEIYAAVVRRLVTKDHTFGGAASPFKHVYIVDGSIPEAGNPHKDTLRPASERFTDELKMEIEEQLRDLPAPEFIVDPSDVRRGEQGMDGVENDGVIITLGPIERKGTEVSVSNGLWCSGRCGQWLTYVLEERGGVWKVTGTTGPSAIS